MAASRGLCRLSTPGCCHLRAPTPQSAAFFGVDRGSFLKEPGFDAFREVVAALRVRCPPAFPVIVRTAALPDTLDGLARRTTRRFVIRIASRLSQTEAIATLIHEWAHCFGWNHLLDRAADDLAAGRIQSREFDAVCHGESFGVAFSACYRAASATWC
jgi:hypothetical protein